MEFVVTVLFVSFFIIFTDANITDKNLGKIDILVKDVSQKERSLVISSFWLFLSS